MTLLDASIIIDALRAKDIQLMRQMHSVGGAVCGVTRAAGNSHLDCPLDEDVV
jgi:hypothetical protein